MSQGLIHYNTKGTFCTSHSPHWIWDNHKLCNPLDHSLWRLVSPNFLSKFQQKEALMSPFLKSFLLGGL